MCLLKILLLKKIVMGLLSKVMPGKKKSKNGGGGNSNEGTPPPSPPTDEKSTPKLPLTEDGAKPQADDEQKPAVQVFKILLTIVFILKICPISNTNTVE